MRALLALFLCSLCLAACESNPPAPEGSAVPAAAGAAQAVAPPWPTTFMEPAVLVAREVRIEGSEALRDHLALRIDPNLHEYVVKTTPEGLLQEVTLKAGNEGEVVHCYLDRLEIAAERKVIVLERPGRAPLNVTARGEAFWQQPGKPEQRGEFLSFGEFDPR
jgi:hypothetical protein